MDLSVIIVNYKSLEKTKKCLRALLASDLSGLSFEVIVVDNNSGDNIDSLKEEFSQIKTVKSPKNFGMGEGNNLGINNSRGEYVLILNPDTYLEKTAVKKLYDYMENHPKAGITGPRLSYPDGSLQYSCMAFPKIYTPILRRTILGNVFKNEVDNFRMADFDHAGEKAVDWIMGSALMIRRSLLNKIGPAFDKRFFMFFEDTDLCRRANQAGYQVIYLADALGIHDHTRASARGRWYIAPFTNKLARAHIASWVKYFWKWKAI